MIEKLSFVLASKFQKIWNYFGKSENRFLCALASRLARAQAPFALASADFRVIGIGREENPPLKPLKMVEEGHAWFYRTRWGKEIPLLNRQKG